MSFKNSILIIFSLLLISCKSEVKKVEVASKKPNVLIIFPDQLRRYSAGFWKEDNYKKYVVGKSDPVITPTIDKLAKNGVVFTQAVSNYPLCSPYRGMMLSGMYPQQNGIWNNCKKGRVHSLKDDISTIPDLFYKAGYNTSYFGKCHWLKTEPLFDENGTYVGTTEAPGGHYVNTYDTYVPPGKPRHNIEYFYQALKDEHFNPRIYSNDPDAIEGKKDGELHLPKVFSAKNEADKIITYLRNEKDQRNSDKPFCMIWSMNPPHNPWDDENTDMETLHEYYDTDKFPKVDDKLVVRENADLDVAKYARHYYANVTSADNYVGHVIDELEKMGELDNTIVIFSSDHGEMLGSHSKTGKNSFQLESLSIPFIVHWPKHLKAGITDVLFSAPDVLPTALGLAGLANEIPKEVQGTNFAELLVNPENNSVKKPEDVLIMLGNSRGIFSGKYTLCLEENKKQWDTDKGTEISEAYLYDNINDPYQLNKINIKDLPEVANKLLKSLGKKLKMANDPWFQQKKYSETIPYPKS
ncbi:sulfatase family protein [Lutibacter citreus]|uniref:sulfatase family protein n=1 Tax=Lutibacter citreus TaxID=2138210 RepID=UPI000DBE80B7|nr:sulfatase [Lutibacter citreus]